MPALEPAVEQLVDELEANVHVDVDGTTYWDRGAPHLNTAFAAMTLMNAGRDGPILDSAISHLVNNQDPVYGHWEEAVFFYGRSDSGKVTYWSSAAFTTAMALEAIARYQSLILSD